MISQLALIIFGIVAGVSFRAEGINLLVQVSTEPTLENLPVGIILIVIGLIPLFFSIRAIWRIIKRMREQSS